MRADIEPASRGLRTLRIGRRRRGGGCRLGSLRPHLVPTKHQHRRQIRAQFATEHAKDRAESWNGVEAALHGYEEAHRHFLDQLAAVDTKAVINRYVPDHPTKAAALHDFLIHAPAICRAQADPARAPRLPA